MNAGKLSWWSLIATALAFLSLGNPVLAVTPQQTELQKLVADDATGLAQFGSAIALDGDTAVVGAPALLTAGAAYVIARDITGVWRQQFKLTASDGSPNDKFGWSVDLDGEIAVIGAPNDRDNGQQSGSVYVFARDTAGNWIEQAKLVPADGVAYDRFGASVSLDGGTAIVGSPGDDDRGSASGSAYVFVLDAVGNWYQQAKLLASDGATLDQFGHSLAIDGDELVVGAVGDNSRTGSAYVFTRGSNGTWVQEAKILAPDGAPDGHFGWSVDLNRNTSIVGAIWDSENGSGSGSAYIFKHDESGSWNLEAKLSASDGEAFDFFGRTVALESDRAVVGASGADGTVTTDSGAAYVFARGGTGTWSEQSKLVASDGAAYDQLGSIKGIGLSGGLAMLGAPFHTVAHHEQGAAYIFDLVLDDEGPLTSRVLASPNPVAAGNPFTLTANIDDTASGGSNVASAYYRINGGTAVAMSANDDTFDSPIEDITALNGGLPVGVYDLCVSGTDAAGNTGAEDCTFLAVYDPTVGFVTGGGWIESPPGAYRAEATLTGKANFGFVAKYKKGQSTPDGNTQFEFKAGNLNFHSTSYEWLVVAGAKGMFKGSGTINGAGNYGFMLTAVDAAISNSTSVDLFRIKIWDKDHGDAVVYDNELGANDSATPTTVVAGGSIVIHTP